MPPTFSVRVASPRGIPVRIHLLVPAAVLLLVVTTPRYTDGRVLLSLLGFLAILGVSVAAHEAGHALAARAHGLRVRGITLWPFGGSTDVDAPRSVPSAVLVALSGVAVNVSLAALCAAGHRARSGEMPAWPGLLPAIVADPLLAGWSINVALAVLNLFPVAPFDGGMAAEALLRRPMGAPRARYTVLVGGTFVGFGLFAVGLGLNSVLLASLGVMALVEVYQGFRRIPSEESREDLLLGVYDFSKGNTSLEASSPDVVEAPSPPDPRARLDGLLDRIAAEGIGSLSEDERAFLNEESRRLRARHTGKSPTGR